MPNPALLFYFLLTFLARAPVATLYGEVRTADGTLVPGARVALISEQTHRRLPEGTTNAEGRYRLEGLLPGPHTGWLKLGSAATTDGFTTRLAPGPNRLNFVLDRSVIRGRVLSPAGEPVVGARVRLVGIEARDPSVTTSEEDGAFAFLAVQGAYRLSANKAGYGTTSLDALEVTPGSLQEIELDFAPRPTASLRGHVLGLSPEELARTTIDVELDAGEGKFAALVDDRGVYQLDGLSPGERWVRAWCPPKHTAAKVVLVAGEETELDVTFLVRRVSGRAVDAAGHPLADHTLQFHGDVDEIFAQTAADGTFTLDLPDGRYEVYVSDEESPLLFAKPLTVDGSLAGDLEIRFTPAPLR